MGQINPGSLDLSRNAPCFCGSGKKFRRCCGSLSADRPPPHGVNIIENFIPPDQCQDLISAFEQLPAEPLTVAVPDQDDPSKIVRIYDQGRVCSRVTVGHLQQQLNNLVFSAVHSRIENAVGKKFEWFEAPQILKYTSGGLFAPHADNGHQDADTEVWIKAHDRDYSLLLYLGSGFEGGELVFQNFNFTIHPEPGMLVFFPSDGRYLHTARPVTAGVRYAMVSWLSELGIEKVMAEPPEEAVFIAGFQQ